MTSEALATKHGAIDSQQSWNQTALKNRSAGRTLHNASYCRGSMEYWKTPTNWGSLLSTPPMVSGCGEAKQNNYIKWFSEGTQNKRVGANKRHLLAIINLFKSNYSPVSHAPAGHPKPLKVRLRVKFRQLLIGWLHLPCHPPFVSLLVSQML